MESVEPTESARRDGGEIAPAFVSPFWPVDLGANGVVTYVDQIARQLGRRGCRPLVLAMRAEPGPGDDLEVWDVRRWGRPRTLATKVVDRVTSGFDPDRALVRSSGAALAAALGAAVAGRGVRLAEMEEAFGWAADVKARVPITLHVRLHGPWFLNGAANGAREDALFRRRVRRELRGILAADAVSAPSRNVLDQTRRQYGIALEDAVVLPYPCRQVPLERRWKLDEADRDTIIFIGRFDLHKGGDVMIDAFARLAETHPRAKLRFVGGDRGLTDDRGTAWNLRGYMAAKAPKASAEGRIEVLGMLPASSIDDLRRRALVTVAPSRYDNFPNTVLEAASLGAPLVSTLAGGIPEIVADGESALLVPPAEPAPLAVALGRMLDDPLMAARLGAAAAVRTEELHPDRIADRTLDLYRDILARQAVPARN